MEKPPLILWPIYNPVVATGYIDKASISDTLNKKHKTYPSLKKQQSQNLRCGYHDCEGPYYGILVYEKVRRHRRFGGTSRLLQKAGFVPQEESIYFPQNFGNHTLIVWCDNKKC
jgi:hypothetical protein